MRFYIEGNKLYKETGRPCLVGKVYSLDTNFCYYKSTLPFYPSLLTITKRLATSDKGFRS
jgi:hypothetical protein